MDYLLDNKNLVEVRYHAPRGQRRLYSLAENLSREYLFPTDVLVGVIGLEGAGKSTLIRGLFPGLELTNDDEGINHNTSPLFDFDEHDYFSGHTFHLDIRFESAFHQMHEIADAIRREEGNLRYQYFQPLNDPETILLIDSWKDQAAIDAHHASPMMAQLGTLREKYDLHMKAERFVSDDAGLPAKDMKFIKK